MGIYNGNEWAERLIAKPVALNIARASAFDCPN